MEYLIRNTSKEERKEIVKNAFAISIASNEKPTNTIVEIIKQYIDGKKELEEIQEEVIKMYKKEGVE